MGQDIATVIRYSNHGAIELQIDRQGGSVQVNCLMPPRAASGASTTHNQDSASR